jgi:hypothetical protein
VPTYSRLSLQARSVAELRVLRISSVKFSNTTTRDYWVLAAFARAQSCRPRRSLLPGH